MEDSALIERLQTLRKAVDLLDPGGRPGAMDPACSAMLALLLDTAFTSDARVCELVALLDSVQGLCTTRTDTPPLAGAQGLHSVRLELDRLLALGSVT